MAVGGLACPTCGDPAPVALVAPIVRCGACRTALFVEAAPVPRLMVAPLLDAAGARAAATAWMRGVRHRELLAYRARIEPPRLAYLPFLEIEASVVGFVYGTRKHSNDKRTWYTDEEIHVQQAFRRTEPLSATGEVGVERLADPRSEKWRPFDEDEAAAAGEVVPALASEGTVEERAHEAFLATAHRGHDLETITGDALTVLGAKERVLYRPFWRVDYRFGRAAYHVMIDAHNGQVAYGRAPGSLLFHTALFGAVMPVAALVMLIAVLVGGAIGAAGIAIIDDSAKIGGGLVTIGALAGIAIFGGGLHLARIAHRALRQGGEVESGYGAHAGVGLLDLDDTAYQAQRAAEQRAASDGAAA
jgi:hypothetical protein